MSDVFVCFVPCAELNDSLKTSVYIGKEYIKAAVMKWIWMSVPFSVQDKNLSFQDGCDTEHYVLYALSFNRI